MTITSVLEDVRHKGNPGSDDKLVCDSPNNKPVVLRISIIHRKREGGNREPEYSSFEAGLAELGLAFISITAIQPNRHWVPGPWAQGTRWSHRRGVSCGLGYGSTNP